MSRSTALFAVLVSVVGIAQCKEHYTVVAPGTLRPNSEYSVVATAYDTEKPITFKVDLSGPSFNDSKTVEVKAFSSEILKFQLPKLVGDEYNLKVEGSGGVEFKEESKLNVNEKQNSVLIQTDKALYKPGDLVRYRVLILDPNTRPAHLNGPVDIQITDGKQNIIKQIKNVNLTQGVFNGELQLSELPVLGSWTINVDVDGKLKTKDFGVEKYVLPKFEVKVEADKAAYFDDGKIRATIRAKYTYGKPVKGEAEVTIKPKYSYGPETLEGETKKIVPIDGKALVEFTLNFNKQDWDKQIEIFAVVEEKLTGNKQNGTGDVTVHKDRYEIRGEGNPNTFEPGVPMEIKVKVLYRDGSPVTDSKHPFKLSISKGYRTDPINETEHSLDSNGLVTANLTFPDIEYASLMGSYLGVVSNFAYLSRKSTEKPPFIVHTPWESDTKLNARITTEKPSLDNDIEVEVTAKNDMDRLAYQVVGRGSIIHSNIINEIPDKKKHKFSFKPTLEMIPTAHLYVQTIQDGELIWNEQSIMFGDNLKNQISLETEEEAKPGQDVNIKVKTSPNAYVGLLGVDQSVLLLKKGNDLSKGDVFDEIRQYETYNHYSRYGSPGNQAGLITFTNANVTLPPPIYYAFGAAGGDRNPNIQFAQPETTSVNLPQQPIEVRKEFPEVWLWEQSNQTNANGEVTIQKKVPDTITSWVITAFSLDNENGLGLTDDPTKLKVFQPFFVSTNLPYSVKRGEVIAVPVIVFNYMDKTLDTDVILENMNDEFEFTEATNEVVDNPKHELKRSKRMTVPAQSGETVSFMIRPKTVGHITLKMTASSPLAGDAILKMLPVEPEGVTEFVNKAALIDLRDTNEQTEELSVDVPENAVPNSTHIEMTVVGDLLGPTIKNLDSLVRKPYGCGEQNMVNFVPNILVLQYLESIGKLTPEIEAKAKNYMEIGYQRELSYKHDDGSYSAFGKSDKSGSTWLTAYVARSFRQAADYIPIDEKIIKQALDFLAKTQAANGSFPEVGKVIDHQHASDNENGIALTAFTTLAFLQNAKKYPEYEKNIAKALKYIDDNVQASGDLYDLAIGAYAMNVANAPSKGEFMKKLDSRATTESDRKWWAKPEPKDEKKDIPMFYYKPRSANVETTAYALLALLESGSVTESLPVLKWLISQRNSNGGFESTQDTVVGLSALIKFAEKFSSKDPKMDIEFEYEGEKKTSNVDKENAILLQSYELPPTATKVKVNAKGNGIALVQLSCRYNKDDAEASPGFKLDPVVDTASNSDFLKLRVCASYVPAEGENKDSNMAVMEVNLPSGFTIDQDALAEIEGTDRVKKVETKNSETVAVIYFDSLNSEEICPTVQAYKTHKVAQLKPAAVVVYDYYDDTRRARKFYSPPEASLCDICEGEECGTGCPKKEEKQR